MKAKLIVLVAESDEYSEQLAGVYYNNTNLDEFVETIRKDYPQAMQEPFEEEVYGEIQDENDRYILTYADYIEEQMRIYEKLPNDQTTNRQMSDG